MEILGVPVSLAETVPERRAVVAQVRFPRSKRRRIREKWTYRASNYRRFEVWVLFVTASDPPGLLMHPRTWEWFQEVMA